MTRVPTTLTAAGGFLRVEEILLEVTPALGALTEAFALGLKDLALEILQLFAQLIDRGLLLGE
ncbi:hypothetical protein ECTOBSL9_0247 [Ectothiorhodospira sp. BSL-9]|nr:hypothetical protein ECTOBSL9_0247 [Ectothiorhodospira sp. BSL-9]